MGETRRSQGRSSSQLGGINKTQKDGGGNIKRAQWTNWALLAKLAWSLLHYEGALWREMLRAKYVVTFNDGAHLKHKARASQIWRGIAWGRSYPERASDGRYTMANAHSFGKMCGLELRV